ncbi:DUF2746 domain-containing protein [Catenuloplanes sp. NPDC051500]|uniref:DUF2746 domain-containing protein n=1 Tax=Catenuloplanes sp. NPDC051500 TaxID=3363959 RepID=UPI0037BDC41B
MIPIFSLEAPVQAAIVTAVGTVTVALIGVVLEYLRRNHKRLGEVKEQVANSHKTNLRDDIDVVIAELRGLRTEVQQERRERFEADQRTDARLAQLERKL